MSIFVASPRIFNLTPRPARRKARRPRLPRPRPKSNPRAAWPDWTDQRWTIGPEPDPSAMDDAAFRAWLRGKASDAIVRGVLAELVVPNPTGPTILPDAYTPSAEAEAAHHGYQHGFDHDSDAVPDSGLAAGLADAWRAGYGRGWIDRSENDRRTRWEENMAIDRAFVDSMMRDFQPGEGIHEAEALEAIGAVEMRKIGGVL